jgi:DUF4097 and DUF4098 domain-containing protein YvlB
MPFNGTLKRLWLLAIMVATGTVALAAPKECKYTAPPHANVSIVNQAGTINVKPSSGKQVVITGTPASDKVEVDCTQAGPRIEARTHQLQKTDDRNGRVDYTVEVPADTSLGIRDSEGAIQIEGMKSDLWVRGAAAEITVSNLKDAHLEITTVTGPVSVKDVNGGPVEVRSSGGNVQLADVTGPKVTVSTTTGNISYSGDFGGGGVYSFINHSGNIDVSLPTTASVDVDARASHGSVQNDFPLQQKAHVTSAAVPGRSFTGTSNSGSSLVELRSFSGTIRVRKQ